MRTWLLVHSPLLGPLTWGGVADALRARGDIVFVPDLRPALALGPPFARAQTELITAGVDGEDIIVVAHSGAGALVPLVIDTLLARSSGSSTPMVVFVDAGLPQPGRTRLQTLPLGAAAHLRSIADGGFLPPWPRWWPEEELSQLVPDDSLRGELVADSPSLPFALFEEVIPGDDLRPDVPASYLRLSDAYEEDANRAEGRGWDVRRHRSNHLAPLTSPDVIARLLLVAVGSART